jgi:hypothetical protein
MNSLHTMNNGRDRDGLFIVTLFFGKKVKLVTRSDLTIGVNHE